MKAIFGQMFLDEGVYGNARILSLVTVIAYFSADAKQNIDLYNNMVLASIESYNKNRAVSRKTTETLT